MTYLKAGRKSGFTMVELLIAIIIIGILVTIIVPVISNRASDARLAAAKADMEAIANAESQVALDTGYVVRFHVLDDSGVIGDALGSDSPLDVVDTIRDEDSNASAGNPTQVFLDTRSGFPLAATVFTSRIDVDGGPDRFGWKGPYANFQKKLKPTNPVTPFPPGMAWVYGAPLDPWGNPYFLFVGGEETLGGPAVGGWFNEVSGTIDATFNYGGGPSVNAQQFDRLTVLSLGPNGQPGDGSGTVPGSGSLGAGDDLVRAF